MLQDVKQENELKYHTTQDTLVYILTNMNLIKKNEIDGEKKTVWLAKCVKKWCPEKTLKENILKKKLKV